MGHGTSTAKTALGAVTGKKSLDDEVWAGLCREYKLAELLTRDSMDPATTVVYCKRMAENASSSGNFVALINTFAGLAKSEKTYAEALTAAVLLRYMIKFMFQHCPVSVQDSLFGADPAARGRSSGTLVETCLDFITRSTCAGYNGALFVEVCKLLTVSTVGSMFSGKSQDAVMSTDAVLAAKVVARLLRIYLRRHPSDRVSDKTAPPPPVAEPPVDSWWSSISGAAASSVRGVVSMVFSNDDGDDAMRLGPERCVLLLLTLVHTYGSFQNPFRTALYTIGDGKGRASRPTTPIVSGEGQPESRSSTPKGAVVDFAKLFEVIGKYLMEDATTALLYTLIHDNKNFRDYVLSRSDQDVVMLPLLNMMYNAYELPSNKRYMLLVVCLILSQDDVFSRGLHDSDPIPHVKWFKDQIVHNISIGSLMVLVFCRLIIRDLSFLTSSKRSEAEDAHYTITNCLAVLANTAPTYNALHVTSAHKLTVVCTLLVKRYGGLLRRREGVDVADGEEAERLEGQLELFGEFMRISLEIINSVLARALARNPYLVYWVVHEAGFLRPIEGEEAHTDVLHNILTVTAHMVESVDKEGLGSGCSIQDVIGVITRASKAWRPDLRAVPDLRFTYEEESDPESFFSPCLWSLVYQHSGVAWYTSANDAVVAFTTTAMSARGKKGRSPQFGASPAASSAASDLTPHSAPRSGTAGPNDGFTLAPSDESRPADRKASGDALRREMAEALRPEGGI